MAVERTLSGLMVGAASPYAAFNWQVWRLTSIAFIPGAWLLFSLTYARSNAREFLHKWRYALALALLQEKFWGVAG